VVQISERVFRFLVSCREVEFLINHLQYYKCESFIVFFHLWNNGGANWQKELQDFKKDENESWQTDLRKRISYVDAMNKPPLSEANSTPIHMV
jgi:hypothetical protein